MVLVPRARRTSPFRTSSRGLPLGKKGPGATKILEGGDLAGIFGVEMAAGAEPAAPRLRAKAKVKTQSRNLKDCHPLVGTMQSAFNVGQAARPDLL